MEGACLSENINAKPYVDFMTFAKQVMTSAKEMGVRGIAGLSLQADVCGIAITEMGK